MGPVGCDMFLTWLKIIVFYRACFDGNNMTEDAKGIDMFRR